MKKNWSRITKRARSVWVTGRALDGLEGALVDEAVQAAVTGEEGVGQAADGLGQDKVLAAGEVVADVVEQFDVFEQDEVLLQDGVGVGGQAGAEQVFVGLYEQLDYEGQGEVGRLKGGGRLDGGGHR